MPSPENTSTLPSPLIEIQLENEKLDQQISKSNDLIQIVRDQLVKEANKCIEEIYPEDLIRFKQSDLQVKRFIVRVRAQSSDNIVRPAVDAILENLRWRKRVMIRERTMETFPREFFQVALIGEAIEPRNHNKILYINCKTYRRQPELIPHFFSFGNALFDRIDRDLDGKRMVLFLDMSGMSIANADINFLRYYMSLLTYEFPLSLERTFIYDPPWYLKHLISVVLALFPKKLVKNVFLLDRKSALEIFGEEGLPKDAGGQLETYIHPPSKCPSADEYVKLYNLPKQVVEKAKKDYGIL